jgi:hypothetical protein
VTKRFILFAASDALLDAALKSAGTSLDKVGASFDIAGYRDLRTYETETGRSNNPWAALDAEGKPVSFGDNDLGFGLVFEGAKSDVEQLLYDLRETGVAGGDLDGTLMTVAQNWQNWCPGGASRGRRDDADRLIGAEALKTADLRGAGVNVVIVDQGLSRDYIFAQGGAFGGGLFWDTIGFDPLKKPGEVETPYRKQRQVHGNMIARNVLALIPQRIDSVESFAIKAAWAYFLLNVWLLFSGGNWVIVNAWGVPNRFREEVLGSYTEEPLHPMNLWTNALAKRHDVIFAAGNSGQFCPDQRTGPYDAGPGRSIWGANALNRVISVGAVRTDSNWIGMSSQGPGPMALGSGVGVNEKPDLTAPSWFRESFDAGLESTGTSASCAVTAGAVAALRERWGGVSPETMRRALRDGAREFWHDGWNGRMGAGVLNIPGTIGQLPAK